MIKLILNLVDKYLTYKERKQEHDNYLKCFVIKNMSDFFWYCDMIADHRDRKFVKYGIITCFILLVVAAFMMVS